MGKYYIMIISWLLHHANRQGTDKYFYEIKNRILSKYGTFLNYDVQFIEGKKCKACGGTGIHYYYSWYDDEIIDMDYCWYCYNGWYKRPTWNILAKIQFGKYTFHQPFKRVYEKPDTINLPIINGYIDHIPTKHGKFCLTILFLLYEKGYLKRWYKYKGIGWAIKWYIPSNYANNIIHIIKHGRNSIPFKKRKNRRKILSKLYSKIKFKVEKHEELPF